MREKLQHIIAVVTIIVFVNFMFSNTIFMHSHTGADGKTVTHSHPYLPTSGHQHSAQSLNLISIFNASAASANVSMFAWDFSPNDPATTLVRKPTPQVIKVQCVVSHNKAPPVLEYSI